MTPHSVSVEVGGRTLTISTGKYAKQAGGAVFVQQDDSITLVTATAGAARPGLDFFPLTAIYQDRTGSYGRIPGGFFKREGRPNERETLASRVIDRSIRPMFPKAFKAETQVIATVVSYDPSCDTDVLSAVGASAALHISNVPFDTVVASVRIVRVDGEFVINPSNDQIEASDIHIVVSGTSEAISMVEGGANEAAEADMLDGLELAHTEIKKIIVAIEELRSLCGREKITGVAPAGAPDGFDDAIFAAGRAPLVAALATPGKHERKTVMKASRNAVIAEAIANQAPGADDDTVASLTSFGKAACGKLLKAVMREGVIETGTRMDGRATDEIRAIWSEVGVSPRAHGSAMFTRGETQVYANIALGTDWDAQRLDYANAQGTRRSWMLSYFFPPFCTGEAYRMMGPKRREIGHGALAHRAITPMLPAAEDFPYVVRSTCDVLESNGSSSMATVCGTTLAMLNAGVPLKAPVAGIAMGLIKEGDKFAVLSDILGDEDGMGDMDFKVTGTEKGITAFQMDVKIAGVTREIMNAALEQARVGRIHILGEMAKTMSAPAEEMSEYAPRITTIMIKPDKIRDIIGPGGKNIRAMQEATGTRIKVDDSGRVEIASVGLEGAKAAEAMVREITQEAEIGKIYVGVVKNIMAFGIFVEIWPGTDGLVRNGDLSSEYIDRPEDVFSQGDTMIVRCTGVDDRGRISLSRKHALEEAASM